MLLINIFSDDPVRLAETLNQEEPTIGSEKLLEKIDAMSRKHLADSDRLLLTQWADLVRDEAEARLRNNSVVSSCRDVVNQTEHTVLQMDSQLQTPSPVDDQDAPDSCQELSFLEISGVLFWSLLVMGMVGLLLWKICRK